MWSGLYFLRFLFLSLCFFLICLSYSGFCVCLFVCVFFCVCVLVCVCVCVGKRGWRATAKERVMSKFFCLTLRYVVHVVKESTQV